MADSIGERIRRTLDQALAQINEGQTSKSEGDEGKTVKVKPSGSSKSSAQSQGGNVSGDSHRAASSSSETSPGKVAVTGNATEEVHFPPLPVSNKNQADQSALRDNQDPTSHRDRTIDERIPDPQGEEEVPQEVQPQLVSQLQDQEQEDDRLKLPEDAEDCANECKAELGAQQQHLTGTQQKEEDHEMTVTDSQSQGEENVNLQSTNTVMIGAQTQPDLLGKGQIGNWADLVEIEMGDQGPRGIKGRGKTDPNYTPDKGNSQKKRAGAPDYQRVDNFQELGVSKDSGWLQEKSHKSGMRVELGDPPDISGNTSRRGLFLSTGEKGELPDTGDPLVAIDTSGRQGPAIDGSQKRELDRGNPMTNFYSYTSPGGK
ncbi:hypothetical protein R1sor_013197 [Riccia sorocarpa]|uniref:Uncharacterized protein n=1 Tax=Riccia sorocarpa TaxID=122646 RepID=A0ABD3H6E8_9MARC